MAPFDVRCETVELYGQAGVTGFKGTHHNHHVLSYERMLVKVYVGIRTEKPSIGVNAAVSYAKSVCSVLNLSFLLLFYLLCYVIGQFAVQAPCAAYNVVTAWLYAVEFYRIAACYATSAALAHAAPVEETLIN